MGKIWFLMFSEMIESAAPLSTSMGSKEPFNNISTTVGDDDPFPMANMLNSLGTTLSLVDTHFVGRQFFLPGFFLEGFCPLSDLYTEDMYPFLPNSWHSASRKRQAFGSWFVQPRVVTQTLLLTLCGQLLRSEGVRSLQGLCVSVSYLHTLRNFQ